MSMQPVLRGFFASASPNILGNSALRVPQREGFKAIQDHYSQPTTDTDEVGIVLPVGVGKSALIALDTARDLAAWIMPKLRTPAAQTVAAFAARLRRLDVPYRLAIRTGADRRDRRVQAAFGSCAFCGTPLTRAGRKYCSRQCTLQRLYETQPPWKKAQAALLARRAEGQDPGHGGEAAKKRGDKIAASNRNRAKYVTTEEKRLAANDRARRYRERNMA